MTHVVLFCFLFVFGLICANLHIVYSTVGFFIEFIKATFTIVLFAAAGGVLFGLFKMSWGLF